MKGLSIVCALLSVLPYITLATPIPDTGQTKCYDSDGVITCPSVGQDFYGQGAQYVNNPQSYTKLNSSGNPLSDNAPWAMVRDNVTGLIWEVKDSKDNTPDYENPHDADNTYTWYDSNPVTNGGDPGTPGDGTDTEDFIDLLNSTQFGGYDDWRLPTIKELSFIQNLDTYNPTIDTTYFPHIYSYYWSSTAHAGSASYTWNVNFDSGYVSYYGKSDCFYVRAVRGGQSGSSADFVDNGDGTVTDNITGLMWQKDGFTQRDWEGALSYCENLSLVGYNDWRLPDVNELQSIVDYTAYNPSIDQAYSPNTVPSNYWSSTPCTSRNHKAWNVNFGSGSVSYYGKTDIFYARAVRGGH